MSPERREGGFGFGAHGCELRAHALRSPRLVEGEAIRADLVADEVRGDEAEGREHAGRRRDDDGCDPKHVGDPRSVQRSCATEGHQDVITRIPPALGGNELDRADDVVLGHPHRVIGDLLHAAAELPGQRRESVAGEFGIDVHAPAEEGVGEHGAADEVRVGDRGLRAAAPVAGGAGLGAGRAGADAQHAAVVAPDDRASSGAYGHDVEHRNADGEPVDLGIAGQHRRAALHQAHVGARASHVEGDEIPVARAPGLAYRAHHARCRPRIERGDRVAGHAARRQSSAVRLHQAEAARKSALAQCALKLPR